MRDLLEKLKLLENEDTYQGEVQDFEFTGDDGETGFGTLYYTAINGKVDPNSLKGEAEGDGNNKLDDELATAVVQPDGPDHEYAMDAAQEDYDEVSRRMMSKFEDVDDEQTFEGEEFFNYYGYLPWHEDVPVEEAEYRGRKVSLGKPMQGDVKKFKVYVRDPKTGNIKKVNFGDPNMRIKKSNPKRRKSFRARHNCSNPGPRTKARYWSCRKW